MDNNRSTIPIAGYHIRWRCSLVFLCLGHNTQTLFDASVSDIEAENIIIASLQPSNQRRDGPTSDHQPPTGTK
ncbi:unnamed protein product [Didymodactylos carnosus]|uniref:Uncharacterized protein n=1 Tax=Didymodactylos carnosus TaxID=1234261 RepID=A0A8S2F6R7_9BILA|nr:unnamed protein product [Didymodactylos carnosus]CAF4173340.1 unnamed protein product [Didymodactylos carnosus]